MDNSSTSSRSPLRQLRESNTKPMSEDMIRKSDSQTVIVVADIHTDKNHHDKEEMCGNKKPVVHGGCGDKKREHTKHGGCGDKKHDSCGDKKHTEHHKQQHDPVHCDDKKVEDKGKHGTTGTGVIVGTILIWFIIIFLLCMVGFYFTRPWFVLKDPEDCKSLDVGRLLLISFIVALFFILIIWLIKSCWNNGSK